jgi:hypothetical protein
MKPVLAFVVLVALGVPASGHFIWLIPPEDRNAAGPVMVFSDSPAPDENVPITKIAKTPLFGVAGKGDAIQVKMTEDKTAYNVSHTGEGMVMIAGTCQYGVVAKGKGKPFLLRYYSVAGSSPSGLQRARRRRKNSRSARAMVKRKASCQARSAAACRPRRKWSSRG